jgi:hypothetical protein
MYYHSESGSVYGYAEHDRPVRNGSIVIAEDRLYSKPKNGGLGLINLKNYVTALQCSWVKRCRQQINDPWRWNLAASCNFRLEDLNPKNIDGSLNPVEYNIAVSYELFKKNFLCMNENFLHARLINNDMFLRAAPERRAPENGLIDRNLLGGRFYDENKERLLRINMGDLVHNGAVVGYRTFLQNTGINFSQVVYLHLVRAGNFALTKYAGKAGSDGTSTTIGSFLDSLKKGSRRFRMTLETSINAKNIESLRVVKTFFGLTDCPVPDSSDLKILYSVWNWTFLSNRVRTFSFQFFNNSLGIKSRIAARYRNGGATIDQRCTFCVKAKSGVAMREDFPHIFLDCPYIRPVCDRVYNTYFNIRLDEARKRRCFFTGLTENFYNGDNTLNVLTATLINYTLWQWRIKKIIPSVVSITNDVDFLFECVTNVSKKVENLAINSGTPICRRWRAGNYGRG